MRDIQTDAGGIKSSSAAEQNILPGSNLRVGKLQNEIQMIRQPADTENSDNYRKHQNSLQQKEMYILGHRKEWLCIKFLITSLD